MVPDKGFQGFRRGLEGSVLTVCSKKEGRPVGRTTLFIFFSGQESLNQRGFSESLTV